jgi:hypothetical protein
VVFYRIVSAKDWQNHRSTGSQPSHEAMAGTAGRTEEKITSYSLLSEGYP